MPGVYKEKICPVCDKTHRRRGPYCSNSCSAKDRTRDEVTREKISDSMKDFFDTPEGIAQGKVNNRRYLALRAGETPPVTVDDFCVDIPTLYELPEGYIPDF